MSSPSDLHERLLAAFRAESAEQITEIRRILNLPAPARKDLEEAFRFAHSMKGGARVCDLGALENAAHDLESELAALRSEAPEEFRRRAPRLLDQLDAVEDLARQQLQATKPAGAAPAVPKEASGTVRISTKRLDQLLSLSGRLLAELLPQERISQEFQGLTGILDALSRELGEIREQLRPHFSGNDLPVLIRIDEWRQQLLEGQRRARRLTGLQMEAGNGLRALSQEFTQEVTAARLVAASVVFEGFGTMVRDIARESGREIRFQTEGLETMADRAVLEGCKDPVMHLLRNALVHGIEPPEVRERQGKPRAGTLKLQVETHAHRLHIIVEDDGAGIPLDRLRAQAVEKGMLSPEHSSQVGIQELLRLIFHAGLSTAETVTEVAGRGVGLAVVDANIRRLGGSAAVETEPGRGTRFDLETALTISAQHLILVQAGDQRIGIPSANIVRLRRIRSTELQRVEGDLRLEYLEQSLPVATLAEMLGISGAAPEAGEADVRAAVVLRSRGRRLCLLVDQLHEQREAVIHELDGPAALPMFAGAAMMESGALVPVLHVAELFAQFRPASEVAAPPAGAAPATRRPRILVVDDSFTTRTLERSILEAHGYRVFVAVDGLEALAQLRSEPVDLVISDIQMPRMDGFTLVTEIKADPKLREIPVVLVSSMEAPEDQERGLAIGAEAYIVKRKFDHEELIAVIRQLL